jgi:hypothetical protein
MSVRASRPRASLHAGSCGMTRHAVRCALIIYVPALRLEERYSILLQPPTQRASSSECWPR